MRKSGERVIDKLCESDKFKTYAFQALRCLEEYQKKNEFPENYYTWHETVEEDDE